MFNASNCTNESFYSAEHSEQVHATSAYPTNALDTLYWYNYYYGATPAAPSAYAVDSDTYYSHSYYSSPSESDDASLNANACYEKYGFARPSYSYSPASFNATSTTASHTPSETSTIDSIESSTDSTCASYFTSPPQAFHSSPVQTSAFSKRLDYDAVQTPEPTTSATAGPSQTKKQNKRQAELAAYDDKYSRKHQLPDQAVDVMNEWFDDHVNNPYPTIEEKERMAQRGGISVKQVNAWFSNRRNRSQNTKPKRMKRVLESQITNIFNELVDQTTASHNPVNTQQLIERFRSTLVKHEMGL